MRIVVKILGLVFCSIFLVGCTQKSKDLVSDSLVNESTLLNADSIKTDSTVDVNDEFWIKSDKVFEPEQGANITIWVENEEYGENLLAAWNKIDSSIVLEYEIIPENEQRTELEEQGPSGTGADLIMVPQDQIHPAVSSGILMEFSDHVVIQLKERLISNLMVTGNIEKKQYSAPIDVDTVALIYNKNLVGEFIPDSFESLMKWSKDYFKQTGSWGLSWEVDNAFYNYIFLSAFGYKMFEDNVDPGLNSNSVTQGLNYFKNTRSEANDIPSNEASWDNTVIRFQQGILPFTITGPWAIDNAVRNGISVGALTLPTIEGKQVRTLSSSHQVAISAYTEYPRAAQNVLLFMMSYDGLDIYYQSTGKIPATKNPKALQEFGKNEVLVKFAEQGLYSDPIPVNEYIQFVWEPMAELFVNVWDNTTEIADAQINATDSYNRLVQTRLYK